MTADEYTIWTKFHRDLFQMKSDDDLPMFRLWAPSLSTYSLTELRAASLAMASNVATAGRFRTEHLAIILDTIRLGRHARTAAEFAELDAMRDREQCQLCGGTGCVFVPHPGCLVDGGWQHPWSEAVVSCRCNRGSAWHNSTNSAFAEKHAKRSSVPRVISLEEYEACHSDWRGLVADRTRNRKAMYDAEHHAGRADAANPIDPAAVRESLEKLKRNIGVCG